MVRELTNSKIEIFLKRYFGSLQVKGLQSYKLSKLEIWKKSCRSAHVAPKVSGLGLSPGRWYHP